ncbi:aquaporin [Pseudoduganella sp. UC29_106]|uniref:aquaporin n=1 Tax=Pseudoduganella sp. UC29_106 TaxID=3374553 RepID=UPI003757C706
MTLSRRLAAEGLGTTLLLAVVVGSGIMAERLSGGNVGVALLANTIATGAGLVALILMFGTISGAHFNPAVTLSEAWQRNVPAGECCRTSWYRSLVRLPASPLRTACLANRCSSPRNMCAAGLHSGGASSWRPLV